MRPRFEHSCDYCTFLGTKGHFDYYFCSQGKSPEIVARFGNLPGQAFSTEITKDGSLVGDFANSLGAYWALAKAKELGLFSTLLEQRLLDRRREVQLFLVVADSNPYGQRPVKLFTSKRVAETYAKACLDASNIWESIIPTLKMPFEPSPPEGWSLLDPRMGDGVSKPSYSVIPLTLSGITKLELSNDICPICHQQVYETSQGRICEQGHEVY